MKTKAVRLYGEMDLRLEEFDLPEMKNDEILARVMSDSLCTSTYKAVKQGSAHKRVHEDVADHPAIVGHEFCGEIVKVGAKWAEEFKPGDRFIIQPALNYKGSMDSPGYSYEYFGGDCTYCIFPHEAMEVGALMPFDGDSFYKASLGEPLSCSIGAMHAQYHTRQGVYHHEMGLKRGGNLIIMGGCGPMGLGAVAYACVCEYDPDSRGGDPADGRKVKGATIHWVDSENCVDAEVRLYDNLFTDPNPDGPDKNFLEAMNPESLTVLKNCKVETSMVDIAREFDTRENRTGTNAPTFQFMRVGFFCLDNKDSRADHLVFNRSVSLRDGFKK